MIELKTKLFMTSSISFLFFKPLILFEPYFSLLLSKTYFSSNLFQMEPIDPQKLIVSKCGTNDPRSPTETLISGDLPASSMGTSQEEDSSNQNSSDCKSPGQR